MIRYRPMYSINHPGPCIHVLTDENHPLYGSAYNTWEDAHYNLLEAACNFVRMARKTGYNLSEHRRAYQLIAKMIDPTNPNIKPDGRRLGNNLKSRRS